MTNKEEKRLSSYLKELSDFLEQNEEKDKFVGKHLSEVTNFEHFIKLNIDFKISEKGLTIELIKNE